MHTRSLLEQAINAGIKHTDVRVTRDIGARLANTLIETRHRRTALWQILDE